eukprot:scaffold144145_cov16-Prasinocladus_malaysianus.AAC.1
MQHGIVRLYSHGSCMHFTLNSKDVCMGCIQSAFITELSILAQHCMSLLFYAEVSETMAQAFSSINAAPTHNNIFSIWNQAITMRNNSSP